MTTLAFLGLGIFELVVIGFVALLVFGGRLPEVMRNFGRSYARFRHGMTEFTNPIRDEMRRLDVTTPRPAPGSHGADLPPVAANPPPSYEPTAEPIDGRQEPPDEPQDPVPDRGTKRAPRPTGGVADEPPPV